MPPTAAAVRRVAAPYKMNRHKIPQNPRADDIRPYTVQYTSAAVFLRANKARLYGVPLATARQIPIAKGFYIPQQDGNFDKHIKIQGPPERSLI